MHIFLSSEDNPALASPMGDFTHTGYHKSTGAAAFDRIFGHGIVIIAIITIAIITITVMILIIFVSIKPRMKHLLV